MTWTYTAGASDKDNVRLLITDVDSAHPIFTDEEINAYLALQSNNVWYAAATALLTIAASETLTQKRIKLLDLSTDGPAEAEALRKLAAEYKATGDTLGTGFDYAELVYNQFGFMEKVIKDGQRGV